MKRTILLICAIALAVSCSPRMYNVTKSYDDAHFEELQRIIDNPATGKDVSFSFTDA